MKGHNHTFWTTCTTTGKHTYENRKTARRIAKTVHPGEHMSVYECGGCNGWHIGHLPEGIKTGQYTRDDLGRTA